MQRVFIFLVLILFSVMVAEACSCPSSSPEKAYRKAKAVFIGRLVEIGTEEIKRTGYSSLRILKFKVEKKWKGISGDEVTIYEMSTPGPCKLFDYQAGESYLLYMNKDSTVSSSFCGWSIELNSDPAKQRIKNLNSFWFKLKANLLFF